MKQPLATLCSLALLFWGYQTGAWVLAIPMAFAIGGSDVVLRLGQRLEKKGILKRRQKISWDALNLIHVLAGFLWLVSLFYLPSQSPFPLPYTIKYHLFSALPVLLFPCVLAQTYCVESVALYNQFLMRSLWFSRPINFYYPYFGLCLFAASVTGGHYLLFLTIMAVLVGGFLWTTQRPSTQPTRRTQGRHRPTSRFSVGTFYGLVGLALVISILGANQLYWLQGNVKFRGPAVLGDLMRDVVSFSPPEEFEIPEGTFDGAIPEEINREELEDAIANAASNLPQSNQGSSNAGNANVSQGTSSGNTTADALENIATSAADSGRLEDLISSQNIDPQSEASDPTNLPQDIAQAIEQAESLEEIESLIETSPANAAPDFPPEPLETGGPSSAQNIGQQPSGINGSKAPSIPGLIQSASSIIDPEQSPTRIGKTGLIQLSNAVLFRVAPVQQDSQSPTPTFPLYVRSATYNSYAAGTWKAANPIFTPQAPSSKKQRWTLGAKTGQTTSVRISTTLPQRKDTLKLPVGTSEIQDLPVKAMAVNQYGTVSVQGKPGPMAYTVQFDPSRSLDSPPTPADRAVPKSERQTLQKVTKSLNLKGKSDAEVVESISTFFKSGFKYSLELAPPPKNRTPLAAFLLDHRSGHCEYFASATSLLLREAGIPARYAGGYYVHEYSPSEKQYIVRASNAHAWVMAYVNGNWITVETTPGGGASQGVRANVGTAQQGDPKSEPSSGATSEQAQGSKQGTGSEHGTGAEQSEGSQNATGSKNGANQGEVSRIEARESVVDKLAETLSTALSEAPENLVPLLLLAAVVVVAVAIALYFFFYFLWKLYRKLRPHPSGMAAKGGFSQRQSQELEPEFHFIEQRLAEWNLRRDASESPKQWILRLKQKLPADQIDELQQIVDLQYRYRFDPQGIDPEDQAKLKVLIQAWLQEYCHRPVVTHKGAKR